MIFKEALAQLIGSGQKTQTRRPCHPGDMLASTGKFKTVFWEKGRRRYETGRDYAVQTARGGTVRAFYPDTKILIPLEEQASMESRWRTLNIKVLDIWMEDVRDISHEDAIAEGFGGGAPKYEFLSTWTGFYDPPMMSQIFNTEYDPNTPNHCPLFLWDRPKELYMAWALKFEVLAR